MWLTLLGIIGCIFFFWMARNLRKGYVPFWQGRRKLCDPYFSSEVKDGPGRFRKGCTGAEIAQLVERNAKLRNHYARLGYERRGELDDLLLDLIRTERASSPDIGDISLAAKVYLDRPWMHLPYLTYYLRTLLVGALVDPFERAVFGAKIRLYRCIGISLLLMPLPLWFFAGIGLTALIDWLGGRVNRQRLSRLQALYEDVRWKGYEPEEIIRRLRAIEENGVNVPSIAYSLFRLPHDVNGFDDKILGSAATG